MVLAAVLVAIALLGFAAWRDVATRTIPDEVSIALAVIGIAMRGSQGIEALAYSVAAALLLGGVLVFLHGRGFLGGGDVKLATALAVGLAPLDVWNLVVAVAFAGGVLGLLYLALQRLLPDGAPTSGRRARGTPGRLWAVESWRIRRRGPLPYGVAIAAGGTIVLLQTTAS